MSIEHSDPLIQLKSVSQSYGGREVLHDVNLSIQPHELTVITGPSGSGKSTLLNIAAGIARPTAGEVLYYGDDGQVLDVTKLRPGRQLDEFRSTRAGFVPQRPNLLGNLSAGDNIKMPARLAGHEVNPEWARQVSEALEIEDILGQKALTLSGGQQQRVALARALVRKPDVVLADEPSAALDTEAKEKIHELLLNKVVRGLGSTVLMVSHDEISTQYADRVIEMTDGRIRNGAYV